MRVAVAADAVAYEKSEARRRRDGGATPSWPTGAACSARKGEAAQRPQELDRVLRAFGDAKDRLVVGEHPADAAADPGGGGGERRDATTPDAPTRGRPRGSDDGDRGADVWTTRPTWTRLRRRDVLLRPRCPKQGRESIEKPGTAKKTKGDRGKEKRSRILPARDASETTYAGLRTRATAAPGSDTRRPLRPRWNGQSPSVSSESVKRRGTQRASRAWRKKLKNGPSKSWPSLNGAPPRRGAGFERKHAESRGATANADANAARGDATAACARYEATERELGKTLVSLEDARAETEK